MKMALSTQLLLLIFWFLELGNSLEEASEKNDTIS
uniref:Asparaginyl-tRNA synthetase 2, mitochondrial n=1 Tax=Macaca fascicularis TaxID=9541 RepID=I7GPE4_MACFA|nr:unnamed protein product [Macaca fascicularis]